MRLRRRKAAVRETALEASDPGGGEWTRKQDLRTRTIRGAMWAAVAAGPVALLLVVTGIGSPQSAPVRSTVQAASVDQGGQARAEDVALSLVGAWLQGRRGDEEKLSAYVRAEGVTFPANPAFVVTDPQVAAVSVNKGEAGSETTVYTVTVSASVAPAEVPDQAAVRRFYEVPVVVEDMRARAATLPAPVAAPAPGDDVRLGYRNRVNSSHPVSAAVTSFLAALTSGEGEVSRYISPGASIRAIAPAPYDGVRLVDLVSDIDFGPDATAAPADGDQARVVASVELSVGETRSVTAQYALTVVGRGGRWEVSAVDSSPVMVSRSETSSTPEASSSSGVSGAPMISVPPSSTSPESTPTSSPER